MIPAKITFLSGAYAPDMEYRNVYFYDDIPGYTPAEILERNENITSWTWTIPEDVKMYGVTETPTSFSLVLPIAEFRNILGDYATYAIITDKDGAVYYAFASTWALVDTAKYRVVFVIDEWTTHYSEIIASNVHFSRRHVKRKTSSIGIPIYNGLTDPLAEQVVERATSRTPLPVYGITSDSTYEYIPLWKWVRVSTQYAEHYENTKWVPVSMFRGVDPAKGLVPVIAGFVGIVKVTKSTGEATILFSQFTTIGAENTNGFGEDYLLSDISNWIADAWISVIPPAPVEYKIPGVDGWSGNVGVIIGNRPNWTCVGDTIRIGSGTPYAPPSQTIFGTLTAVINDYVTDRLSYVQTITEEIEPKINETDYNGRKVIYNGTEIDISPAPGREHPIVSFPVGGHGNVIVKSGGVELLEIKGVSTPYLAETITEALTSFLLTNRQTYQNAQLWRGIQSAAGIVTAVGGAIAGNPMALLGGAGSVMAIGQQITGNKARIADLRNTPNSTSISSNSAIDNLPYVDAPLLDESVLTDVSRSRVLRIWSAYGYPSNDFSTIAESMIRTQFVFVQGDFADGVPGLLPEESEGIRAAISRGSWVWRLTETGEEGANTSARDVTDVYSANISNGEDW